MLSFTSVIRNKKNIGLIATLSMLLLIATACGNGDSSKSSDDSDGEGKVELVASTINPANTLLGEAFVAFAEEIENKSNGEIEVSIHMDGALGDANCLYQSVSTGDIDIIYYDHGWIM